MNFLFYTTLFSLSLILVGCGGGGGSKSSPPPATGSSLVASSNSVSTNSSATISSLALSSSSLINSSVSVASSSSTGNIQLTVRGKVIANALAGGNVIFTIGEKSYSTTVDSSLGYSVTLNVPAADIGKPFVGVAAGAGDNAWVQLAATYPSTTRLVELAGVDKVLEASEYLAVNISAFTTAEYSMIREKMTSVTNDVDRNYALLKVNNYSQIQLAGLLQQILNDNNSAAIGAYKSTLAMFADTDEVNSRLNVLLIRRNVGDLDVESVLQDSNQMRVSTTPLTGTFLVQSLWTDTFYWLTLDTDGSGHIVTSNSPTVVTPSIWDHEGKGRRSDLTWTRNNNTVVITPDAPLNYGKQLGLHSNCNDCDAQITSFTFALIAQNDTGVTAEVNARVERLGGANTIVHSAYIGYMQLHNRENQYHVVAQDLQGVEWYTNNSIYKFNADGTATHRNLITKIDSNINWQITNGIVTVDGEVALAPLFPEEGGFSAIEFLDKSHNVLLNNAIQKTSVIKKQLDASMVASDWIGRWNRMGKFGVNATLDFYEDGKYRDGFETQRHGSWTATSATHMSGLANGSWRFEYELLGIYDGKYYFNYCGGMNTEPFTHHSCVVEIYTIDKQYGGNVFWEQWSNPFFQDTNSNESWRFTGHDLYRGSHLISYTRVASNKFYDRLSDKVLELRDSSLNDIKVCEYDADAGCEQGVEYELKRGIEIGITFTGSSGRLPSSTLQPRGEQIRLKIEPAAGYQLLAENITGCDGALINGYYEIPARQDDCDIAVNFTSM